MDSLSLAVISALVLSYSLISKRLATSVVSAAMFFLAGGALVGSSGLGVVDLPATSHTIETLAEVTLALVLFADASRMRLADLRHQAALPARLLGIGLPLTIVLGAIAGTTLFPALALAEAVVLAIILAPTDAALGQAVVSDKRLPSRIRQALNVESGLNDGICVPLLLISLAWADTESGGVTAKQGLRIAAEAIGYGVLAGAAVGSVVAILLTRAIRAGWTGGAWEQVVPVAAALTSYALADWLGGSGFIAAFVGGLVFGSLVSEHEQVGRFLEEAGGLTNAATFVILGAVLVIPSLDSVDPSIVAYIVLSLTAIRMVPVAIALVGTHARPPTVSFIGWFGPRGLASLVFVVIVQDSGALPHSELIVSTAVATVLMSVFAHGMTALPLVNRYATWYHAHEKKPEMESEHVHLPRWRGQPIATKE